MDTNKLTRAFDLLKEAFEAHMSEDDWAEFGRATVEAIRDGYSVDLVARRPDEADSWRPSARRLWKAAKKVGLR